ncbi:MAG TPA: flagellar export protein FliJ [Clostridiales bacterium]|jgi:flagellar FliJ protein|nr:flagellar export protein FliJ [Clostridiales bacterium]
MKKFRYSMENILRIKLRLEDQAKLSYARARNRLTVEEDKLQNLEDKKSHYEQEQREQINCKLNIKKMRQLSEAIDIMKQKIENQKVAVKTAAQNLEIARVRLNNAMIERKAQERLKEKAWQDYLSEVNAQEQKEIDERNSFNYNGLLL